jgi:hypothetical protein
MVFATDGTVTTTHADGTTSVDANQIFTTTYPNGDQRVIAPDGTITVTARDGTQTVLTADGKIMQDSISVTPLLEDLKNAPDVKFSIPDELKTLDDRLFEAQIQSLWSSRDAQVKVTAPGGIFFLEVKAGSNMTLGFPLAGAEPGVGTNLMLNLSSGAFTLATAAGVTRLPVRIDLPNFGATIANPGAIEVQAGPERAQVSALDGSFQISDATTASREVQSGGAFVLRNPRIAGQAQSGDVISNTITGSALRVTANSLQGDGLRGSGIDWPAPVHDREVYLTQLTKGPVSDIAKLDPPAFTTTANAFAALPILQAGVGPVGVIPVELPVQLNNVTDVIPLTGGSGTIGPLLSGTSTVDISFADKDSFVNTLGGITVTTDASAQTINIQDPNCQGTCRVGLQGGVMQAQQINPSIGRIVNATGTRFGVPWSSGGINSGIHTVFGVPTPLAQMPATGTFTYNFIATTSPTYSDGATAPGRLTGSAVVDFTSLKVGVAMTATMPNEVFTIQTPGGTANPASSTVRIPTTSASHIGSGRFTTSPTTCPTGCTTLIGGVFFGANALFTSVLFNTSLPGLRSLSGAALSQK